MRDCGRSDNTSFEPQPFWGRARSWCLSRPRRISRYRIAKTILAIAFLTLLFHCAAQATQNSDLESVRLPSLTQRPQVTAQTTITSLVKRAHKTETERNICSRAHESVFTATKADQAQFENLKLSWKSEHSEFARNDTPLQTHVRYSYLLSKTLCLYPKNNNHFQIACETQLRSLSGKDRIVLVSNANCIKHERAQHTASTLLDSNIRTHKIPFAPRRTVELHSIFSGLLRDSSESVRKNRPSQKAKSDLR